jgi:hypothetical protein
MASMKNRSMIVTVSDARPIREVVDDLKVAGLHVDQILDSIGIVTGSAHPEAAKRLRGIRGVADVSEDHPVDIGPPRAPVS